MALPLILAGAGLAMQGINYLDSSSARNRAQRMLDQLYKKDMPKFGVDPRMGDYYTTATNLASTNRGYSGAERNAFQQNLGRQLYGQRMAAENIVGGNSAKALNALDILPRVSALNDFAASDATLARNQKSDALNRVYQGAMNFQNVANMNTQAEISNRLAAMQALGGAVSSNTDYMRNIMGGVGSDLITSGIMTGFDGFGEPTTTDGNLRAKPFAGIRNGFNEMITPRNTNYQINWQNKPATRSAPGLPNYVPPSPRIRTQMY